MSSPLSCELQITWQLAPELADRLANVMDTWMAETRIGIHVISGFRTVDEQVALKRAGRPAADPSVSTHVECPATGADIRINGFVTRTMKATFGRIVSFAGLRWGGGSRVDPNTGIPSDWNHVDLGPRGPVAQIRG